MSIEVLKEMMDDVLLGKARTDKPITFKPRETLMHRSKDGKRTVTFRQGIAYTGIQHSSGLISAFSSILGKKIFISESYIYITKGASKK